MLVLSREGRLPHVVSSHSPPCTTAATFSPPHLPPRRDPLYTPSLRRAPHLWQRDLEEEGPSCGGGDDDDDYRRDPATTTTTTMTRRRMDVATRSTRGRGRGGEQAATRSRDPSAPAVWMSVVNLGFEFMACRSKNVLNNSVNAFYQLDNNCIINNNSVIR
jgi:hypothetical protein